MTKSQLNERCRSILYGGEPYKPISIEDQDWLMNNIFNHHPEKGWFDKKGEVDHIEPRHDKSRFHSLCFNIVFTNGSIYDISFHKCINNMTKKDLEYEESLV